MRQFVALLDRHKGTVRAADRRAGEVVAMLYNVNRDSKKDPKGATWMDFFPEWQEPMPVQTEDQMLTAMQMWARVTAPRES